MTESPTPRWADYQLFSENLGRFEEYYREMETQYLFLSSNFSQFFLSVESDKKEGLVQALKADQILLRYAQTTLDFFEKQVRGSKELKELLHNRKQQSDTRKEEIQQKKLSLDK